MNMISKFSFTVILLLLGIPAIIASGRSDNETTKEIIKEFDINDLSDVYFKHRRGDLIVKYIQGDQGRVEAVVKAKGDVKEDLETLMDAMTIEVTREQGQIQIKTANKIVSWNSSTSWWGSRHKIVLSNGKVIRSKVDDISIQATLFLPKVDKLSLNNRYDDIVIEDYKADKLSVDIHSAGLKAGDLISETHIKMKYGKLDIQNIQDLNLDSHDSKGRVGNVGKLIIKDKYSEFKFGNAESLNADLHDADVELESIGGDVNIKDKYSVIKLKSMYNGTWDLHDSKIMALNVFNIKVKTKYSDIVLENAINIEMDCHDDDLRAKLVESLNLTKSKYSSIDIAKLEKHLELRDSHDDNIDIDESSKALESVLVNAKYTELDIPLPIGTGYSIDAIMKYGDLNFLSEGLEQSKYIKDGSDLEIQAKAADGSSKIEVKIRAHDCNIDLKD